MSAKPSKVSDINVDKSATATIENFKDRTDPTYVGPGTWDVIHKRAFSAWSDDDQKSFCLFMRQVCYEYNCSHCREHCKKYIDNSPPEKFVGLKVKVGDEELPLALFAWTWRFHNAVSARIGKPLMSWDTAYTIYSTTDIKACSSACQKAGEGSSLSEKTAEIPETPAQIKPLVVIGRKYK